MSSMMDLAGALGGAQPAGPPTAAPDAPPPPDAAPPDDAAGGGEEYTDSLDALQGAEDALHAFIKLDPDDADRAVAARCLQEILKLKAANQTDTQQGGMKSLQRALASGGAGGGY